MTFFDLLDTATNGLQAQRQRMNIIAENIANANTVGYKRKTTVFSERDADPFASVMAKELGVKEGDLKSFLIGNKGRGVIVSQVLEDKTPGQKIHMPGHPMADKDGYVELANVDSLREMLEMMYATRNYKANLTIVEMVKSATRDTLNIGKAGG